MTRTTNRHGYHDIIMLETSRPHFTRESHQLLERTLWSAHGQDPNHFERAFFGASKPSRATTLPAMIRNLFAGLIKTGKRAFARRPATVPDAARPALQA